MTYTEQDVERVAAAIKRQKKRVLPRDMVGEFTRLEWEQARAALEAMEREPLEDVLRGWDELTAKMDDGVWIVDLCQSLWGNRGQLVGHRCTRGTGAMIDEAIRNAVAAAKGDE